jgi:hypothetical protein
MADHVFHLPATVAYEVQVFAAQVAMLNYALDHGGDPAGIFIGDNWEPVAAFLTPDQGAVVGELQQILGC